MKFMDACDDEVTEEDGQHVDQSEKDPRGGTHLDQLCGQSNCLPAFASGHWRPVARDVTDEMRLQHVISLGFHSSTIEDAGHEALWLAC